MGEAWYDLANMGAWFAAHWFDFLQSAGIIGALVLNLAALREQGTARRVSNLITLTQQHREIWREHLRRPDLHRVRQRTVDLTASPVTPAEETFVKFIIVHLVTAYRASLLGETAEIGKIAEDVRECFSLPIPAAVWEKFKSVQADDFVKFVEDSRRNQGSD